MDGKVMDNKLKLMGISTLLLTSISILALIIPSVIAPATIPTTTTIQPQTINLSSDASYLLIFISPQYHNDNHILTAIQNYQQAIKETPGWNSTIITLTNNTNTIQSIDHQIETIAQKQNLTACMLIGEDITLPIKTTYNTIQKPTLSKYSTINTTQESICISLLQPTPTASYHQKQQELINTLNRFSNKRTITFKHKSTIIEQQTLSTYSQKNYQSLSQHQNMTYHQNIDNTQFSTLFQQQHDLICIHGHGQPNKIQLNSTSNLKLSSTAASILPTSILAIDGCYTDSIYTDQQNIPFISTICSSNTIHLGFFGLLSQQTQTTQQNVINTILPNLRQEPTVAQAINNALISFDFVFTGDPTLEVTL
jgi:hypothetical protein